MGRFVFLSGPSCVGKGPLWNAVKKYNPLLARHAKKVVLYNSGAPRPNEVDGVDYRFRSEAEIKALPENDHIVFRVRRDLQAIDLTEVRQVTEAEDGLGFQEIFHTLAIQLSDHAALREANISTVFISPLSRQNAETIMALGGLPRLKSFLTEMMLAKLIKRHLLQEGCKPNPHQMISLIEHAESACKEIQSAYLYDWVIANRDGEDNPNWELDLEAPDSLNTDARRTLDSLIQILKGADPEYHDKWRPLTQA